MAVVFITGHDYNSPRKVDFHFWAKRLENRQIKSRFVTVGLSQLTKFKANSRQFSKPYNSWVEVSPWIQKYIWHPLFHPISLGRPLLNTLISPIVKLYPYLLPANFRKEIKGTKLFVIENGAGLMLVPYLHKACPDATFVYTVSDRLRTLGFHPSLFEAEEKALPLFDMVRVPSMAIAQDYPHHKNVRYIPPGIDKSLFDKVSISPYPTAKNAVSVGDMLFDDKSVAALADAFPDWNFHLFGKKAVLHAHKPNVYEHGEQAFDTIIPYIKHADVGLAPYHPAPDIEYICQSSLKILQYTYCGLPIVAPTFAGNGKSHIMTYTPGNNSELTAAMNNAIKLGRSSSTSQDILSWDEVMDQISSIAQNL